MDKQYITKAPRASESARHAIALLSFLHGARPMHVEDIKAGMDIHTQAVSARCHEMELFGLLKVSDGTLTRGSTTVTVKAYSLTDTGIDLLNHPDRTDIVTDALKVLRAQQKARALAFIEERKAWWSEMADAARPKIKEMVKKFQTGT